MIALAVFARGRLDARQSGADEPVAATIVCATEVGPVCDNLRKQHPDLTVRVEDAGVTRAALADPSFRALEAGIDAWVVLQPYPAMVGVDRQQDGVDPVLDDPSPTLARSPLVVAIWLEKEQLLQAGPCPDLSYVWKCLGDVGGTRWDTIGGTSSSGTVKVGLAPAERVATGLLGLAQGTAEQLGRTDYSRADLEDGAYRSWLTQLEGGVPDFNPSTGSALGQMLFQGPSSFDAAGSIEALAGPAVAASTRYKDDLDILYPSPDATADVVVAPVRGSAHGGRVSQLLQDDPARAAFARRGWRVDGQPLAAGIRDVPLPPTSGLPDGGVFVALGEVWSEVHR